MKSNRYKIYESEKYFGKYTVIDTYTDKKYDFYNLSSARNWIKQQDILDSDSALWKMWGDI